MYVGIGNDGIDPEISITKNDATEVNLFTKGKNINRKIPPFVWWSANAEKYPHVASLARRFLCFPLATTADLRESLKLRRESQMDVGV